MAQIRNTADFCDSYGRSSDIHLWIRHFDLTHRQLRISVHHGEDYRVGDYMNFRLLHCRGTFFIQGSIQGGPYQINVDSVVDERGWEHKILSGNSNEFIVRCEDIFSGQTRAELVESFESNPAG